MRIAHAKRIAPALGFTMQDYEELVRETINHAKGFTDKLPDDIKLKYGQFDSGFSSAIALEFIYNNHKDEVEAS